MSMTKISLFGKFAIESNDRCTHKLDTRKSEELLCFLLLNRERPHSRESLAEILWGENPARQSKNYLRKALWQLTSSLEQFCFYNDHDLLLTDSDWLQINPEFFYWLDVAVLENAFEKTKGIRGRDLPKEQIDLTVQAVEAYGGDLLEGWYQDWCIYERERLQHLYLALVDKLMDYYEVQEQFENGLVYGNKILRYDIARERTHRRLMRLYYLAGERTASLRQYKKCVAVLWEELEVQPSHPTRLLFKMIQADLGTESLKNYHSALVSGSTITEDLLLKLFQRLTLFQQTLNGVQEQLAREMEAIQTAIKTERN